MFSDKKIAFIGPGMMAEAMIGGMVNKKVALPQQLLVSGPSQKRVDVLKETYGIIPFTDNVKAVEEADIVVLSIKPQRLTGVLEELKGHMSNKALALSIVAGAPISKISSILNHELIVRAMPNTPAQIGEGITVWTAAESVSESQRELAREILTAFGKEVFVEEEDFLNKATALSGTGPAYVYLFMEAMVDAGVHLGFSRRVAEQLVIETVRGSVNYYDRGDDSRHLARLRNQVTSPGGTSAEALYYLEKAGFRTALSRAIWAAYNRSVALGNENDNGN